MNDQVFQLLINKIETLEKNLSTRMSAVEKEVSDLVKFKWKVAGMATAVGILAGIACNIVYSLIQAKGG